MPTVLLHVSDLHFGWPLLSHVAEAVEAAAAAIAPQAVVVSGDIVQRGDFSRLFLEAKKFLDRLPRPLLLVPGNHDLPFFNPFRRFFAPLERFRQYISADPEPVLDVPGVRIVGVASPRSWAFDLGYVSRAQSSSVARALAAAPPGALRVVALHHPILAQPGTGLRRHHLFASRRLARELWAAGCDLVLSGHNHFPKACRLGPEVPGASDLVMAQAGTAASRRFRPRSGWTVQSFNVVRADARFFEVGIHAWDEASRRFLPAATHRFERRPPSDAPVAVL